MFPSKQLPLIAPQEIYALPDFGRFIGSIFDHAVLAPTWVRMASERCADKEVVEIGGGTGRLTKVLLEHCAKLAVFEQNMTFCNVLIDRFSQTGKIQVHNRDFLRESPEKSEVICAHGVLVELLSERRIDAIAESFSNAVVENGTVLFDYFERLYIPDVGEVRLLFDGPVDEDLSVKYSYKYLGRDRDVYFIEIAYQRLLRGKSDQRHRRMKLYLPDLAQVESAFAKRQFTLTAFSTPESKTFFPGDLSLCMLQRH